MSLVVLTPLSQACGQQQVIATSSNPPMQYDSALGTPASLNLVPPYPTMAAHIDEINGVGPAYAWNPITGTWK